MDYAEKMGIQVSDTVDCYTLDEKNKRISWLDLDKFDNHTPEEEENRISRMRYFFIRITLAFRVLDMIRGWKTYKRYHFPFKRV